VIIVMMAVFVRASPTFFFLVRACAAIACRKTTTLSTCTTYVKTRHLTTNQPTHHQELSKRGNNPVYNLLPDIVSRLSQDAEVTRDVFRRVMPFLMGFITKDKHSEALTEKLCFRFATCNSMAQTQVKHCHSGGDDGELIGRGGYMLVLS
jgi:hypothetical protein